MFPQLKALIVLFMLSVLTSSNFQPVSEGKVLWMNVNANGDFVSVSHEFDTYHYLRIAYGNEDAVSTEREMMPGVPSSINIAMCANQLLAAIEIEGSESIYYYMKELSVRMGCDIPDVYIPIVNK